MLTVLQNAAMRNGDRLGVLSAVHLGEVKTDFDRVGVDTSPYYNFNPRDDLGFTERSVLVVASSSPLAEAVFHTVDAERRIPIPPTYLEADERHDHVLRYLTEALSAEGYRIASASGLPCKPLAVHTGIGLYGRNNIVYVEGMGSFCRLFLFFTDWDCGTQDFIPLRFADVCEGCGRCAKSCPSGAIQPGVDRVDADRCLTAVNESRADFPAWVNPDWHHALIGCVRCQTVCPMNRPYVNHISTAAVFNREETETLLQAAPQCNSPRSDSHPSVPNPNEPTPSVANPRGGLPPEAYGPLKDGWFKDTLPRNLQAALRNKQVIQNESR